MIHPEVSITDLDVDGFAHLCGLISQRDMRPAIQLTVLHDAGEVIRVVAPDGVTGADDHSRPFGDAQVRADELLVSTQVDRVVLLDRSKLDGVSTEVVAAAAATTVQSDLLQSAHRIFWSSEAVATAPAPPQWPWTQVQDALTNLGSGWLLLGAWRGDDCVLRIVAEVRGGLVTRITSPAAAPDRAHATQLLRAAAIPTAALLIDIDVLDRVLLDPKPLEALRRVLDENDGVLHAHGLQELLWP